MNASVTHVMYVGLATAALAAGTLTGLSAGTSIDAMRSLPSRGTLGANLQGPHPPRARNGPIHPVSANGASGCRGAPARRRGHADQREPEVRDPLHETEQLRLIADHDDGVAALVLADAPSKTSRASSPSSPSIVRRYERRVTEKPSQVHSPRRPWNPGITWVIRSPTNPSAPARATASARVSRSACGRSSAYACGRCCGQKQLLSVPSRQLGVEQADTGELGGARRVQQLADTGAALCLRQLPADIGGKDRT